MLDNLFLCDFLQTLSEIDFFSDSDVECAPKITKKLPEVVPTKDGDVTRLAFEIFQLNITFSKLAFKWFKFIYEGAPISTLPTKEKRKFWKSGDLFLNIVSF